MPTLKTVYRTVAFLALLHLLALAGGIGFCFATGKVDVDKIREMVAFLREERTEESPIDGPEQEESASQSPKPMATVRREQQIRGEVQWRNAERFRTQIEQRLKFVKAERLNIERQKEAFDRELQQELERKRSETEQVARPGYAKQLEVMAALSPKAALKQLMALDDAEGAQILYRLETRKIKKIVEAAKEDQQLQKMTTLLNLVRDFKTPPNSGDSEGGAAQ